MRIKNPEQARELFRRYFAMLTYFKRALCSIGSSVSFYKFPEKNFFYRLKFFSPVLPKSIINGAILSLNSRVNYLTEKNNLSINEAIKMVNLRTLSRHLLVCYWDLIFFEGGISIKCPDSVISLLLSEPLANVHTLKISQVSWGKYEATIVKHINCTELTA